MLFNKNLYEDTIDEAVKALGSIVEENRRMK